MRVLPLFALVSTICLAGATARADVAPDPDPFMACENLPSGSACYSELGRGICVEADCPNNPGQKCGYCDPNATATTGPDTAATSEAGTGAAPTSSGTSGGPSGTTGEPEVGDTGATSDGSTTKKDDGRGCGCRSDASPGAALALLGLVGLMRRRRR